MLSRGRGLGYVWISGLAVLVGAVVVAVSSAATAGSDTRVTTHDLMTDSRRDAPASSSRRTSERRMKRCVK